MKRTKAVGGGSGTDKAPAVCGFISFVSSLQVAVKIAHWTTESYSRHVALDELHAALQSLGDQFVEVHMGRHGRPSGLCSDIEVRAKPLKESDVPKALRDAAGYLQGMDGLEPELASIRDDMLAAVGKALYLLQLK
jgi:Family of unknown function (DUF5856)